MILLIRKYSPFSYYFPSRRLNIPISTLFLKTSTTFYTYVRQRVKLLLYILLVP
jgi:hypothetical protein